MEHASLGLTKYAGAHVAGFQGRCPWLTQVGPLAQQSDRVVRVAYSLLGAGVSWDGSDSRLAPSKRASG